MSDVNSMLNEFVDISSMVEEVEKKSVKKFWRPTLPKTTIRILPPIKANGEKLPYQVHRTHWINGQPYECINQTMVDKDGNMHTAEPCPICKMVKALYAANTEEAKELARSISAKERYVARIIVRDDKTVGDSPVFYELPFSVYEKFRTKLLSKEWGSLVGPIDGRDLDLIKTGEGRFTKYDSSDFKPSTSKIMEDNTKLVEVIKEAADMSYNSLFSFQDSETLKNVAMENDGVARFFGVTETVKPAAKPAPAPVATEEEFPDDIPVVQPEEKTQSGVDELQSLLDGLI